MLDLICAICKQVFECRFSRFLHGTGWVCSACFRKNRPSDDLNMPELTLKVIKNEEFKTECTCDIMDLMAVGCKCGHLKVIPND